MRRGDGVDEISSEYSMMMKFCNNVVTKISQEKIEKGNKM